MAGITDYREAMEIADKLMFELLENNEVVGLTGLEGKLRDKRISPFLWETIQEQLEDKFLKTGYMTKENYYNLEKSWMSKIFMK